MDAFHYLKKRQIAWAHRHGIALQGSAGKEGDRAYTCPLEDNLFEPLCDEARGEFNHGDGGELGRNGKPGKMAAAHSSSALGVNVFHYWKRRGNPLPLAKALKVPSGNITTIRFEGQLAVTSPGATRVSSYDPNLDVVMEYSPKSRTRLIGVECKFTEAYNSRKHHGIKRTYLDRAELWHDIPACRALAEQIGEEDTEFPHLHAAQLIKHILGLKQAAGGTGRFRLVYLWYDTPFDEGCAHRREVERFAEVAARDGVRFQPITYQELILNLAARCDTKHAPYLAYLTERYL